MVFKVRIYYTYMFILFTCLSEVTSNCSTVKRPELSSFKRSASSHPARFVNPAKTVKPISSSLRAKCQANGDSQPVIKTTFPGADT